MGGEFAIVYTDQYGAKYTTKAMGGHASAETVEAALNSLPDQTLEVSVTGTTASGCDEGWEITFTGDQNPGDQTLLGVLARECQEGCQPRIAGMDDLIRTSTDAEVDAVITVSCGTAAPPETSAQAEGQLYECGRRGKCDYATESANASAVSPTKAVARNLPWHKTKAQHRSLVVGRRRKPCKTTYYTNSIIPGAYISYNNVCV